MIPLKDDVQRRTVPLVTVMLIAANVAVFLYQISLELGGTGADTAGAASAAEALVREFGVVPCRLSGACPADFPPPMATVFTSMFLHGNLFHVGGNMLYLWIFGSSVESALGHRRFLLFYLVCGVVGALGQTAVAPASAIPMIGASGAVSGVLGAYLLLFPYATILTLVVFGFFVRFLHIPALIVLGFWIIVQFVNGFLTVGAEAVEGGGVAWFAHIAGFAGGLALVWVLRPRRKRRR